MHILFIFGALALACVAFLVFNTGEMAARRIRLQNGADAAAHAAATWTARGLNLVSANNVATTQLIALAVLIDSLDVYCDLAPNVARVQQSACENLKWANWPPAVFEGYRWSHCAVREEAFLRVLGEIVDEMVADFHPTEPDHQDSLWQMMYMLEAMSEAAVQATPATAAERAVTLGRSHGGDGAFAWPYFSPLPVEKGDWRDFRIPTEQGTRCNIMRPQFGYQIIYGAQYARSGYNSFQDPEGRWHVCNVGPLRHLRRALDHMLRTAGGDELWSHSTQNAAAHFINLTTISNAKFRLLFDGKETADYRYAEQFAGYPPPPEADRSHWWWMDMHGLEAKPNLLIQPQDYPGFASMEIRDIPTPPTWTLSTWTAARAYYTAFGRLSYAANWSPTVDRSGFPYAPVPGVTVPTYEGFATFQTDFYPTLGIGQWGPGGTQITGPMTTIYHHDRTIFSYSSRSRKVTFFNPIYQRRDLPRPYQLDSSWDWATDALMTDPRMADARMADEWSWLGFAWCSGEVRPPTLRRYFLNPVPGGQMVAVARARLYNRTSWDLFTQDWRVVMLPVGQMPEWESGTAGLPDPGDLGGILSAQDVEPVASFFRAVPTDLHDALVTH